MNATPAVRALLLLAVCLFPTACTKDDKDAPEIIESPGGSEASGSSGAAPEIIGRAAGSSTLLPPGVTAATSVSGLTVTGRASGTVPADRASIVVMLQGTPVGPVPVVSLSQRDRDAILAALQAWASTAPGLISIPTRRTAHSRPSPSSLVWTRSKRRGRRSLAP
jgi:hypothetical protein